MGRADSKTVGLAVVGVGDIGSVHVSKILGSDTARLVAVSDPSSRGESIAVRCGVRNRPDYRDLLSDRPDGVIISVPNALHREVGSFFALAGVHLLVEKVASISSWGTTDDTATLSLKHADSCPSGLDIS
jgi:predicted dehydrogenase